MSTLTWPDEAARYPDDAACRFSAPASNLVLDFHGDPAAAELAIFSDGNHHMALEATVRAFVDAHPAITDVFYTTTPPAPLVEALKGDGLAIGNLRIRRKPDVFIGPDNILQGLVVDGLVARHAAFAQSRGNVLLVRKGNPKGISTVADLLSDEVILTSSNPDTEKASHSVYRAAMSCMAQDAAIDGEALLAKLSNAGPATVHSQVIHHREVPELIACGRADAALVYYHLALRYCRIFPEVFELLDVGGVLTGTYQSGNPITCYHAGVVGCGGRWGKAFGAFLHEETAQRLYESHGLTPVV